MRRALEQRVAAERSRLCEDAPESESQDFESRARHLKVYQDLLSQLPVPWIRRLAVPLAVAGLSVTLVGLVWTVPRSPTRVLLVVEASGVQIAAKQPLAASDPSDLSEAKVKGTGIYISGVSAVRASPGIRLPTTRKEGDSLHLCQGHFVIDKLTMDLNDTQPAPKMETDDRFLDIQLTEKESPTFYLRGGSAQVDLRLWGPVRLARGPCSASGEFAASQILNPLLAETLYVETTVGGPQPVQLALRLDQGEQLVFQQINVDSLRFVREVGTSLGQREFVSTIYAANLSLLDSGASESLGAGTLLELKGFVGRVRQIKIGERVEVQAEGTTARVLAGPPGYQRDLTPSYLQFLKSNKQLGLLWASVFFVWGLLWSGKRLLAA